MISVCIPTYNGEKFIKKQLESILKQLSMDDEVIISDDSSTDSTLSIIDSFNDSRIKLYKNNTFHSPIYNLENALNKAKGEFIFLSDQDDIWNEDKVYNCMKNLEKYDLIVSDAEIIDGDGNLLYESFYEQNKTKKGRIYNFLKNGYLGCCMAFKASVLKDSLPFPKQLPMHDIWIGNIAAFKGYKILFTEGKLIKYRRHGNNASIASEKSSRSIIKRLSDRLIILRELIKKK